MIVKPSVLLAEERRQTTKLLQLPKTTAMAMMTRKGIQLSFCSSASSTGGFVSTSSIAESVARPVSNSNDLAMLDARIAAS